jgi:hypothetical protein
MSRINRNTDHYFEIAAFFSVIVLVFGFGKDAQAQSSAIVRWRDHQDLNQVTDSTIRNDIESMSQDPTGDFPSLYGKSYKKWAHPRILPIKAEPIIDSGSRDQVTLSNDTIIVQIQRTTFFPNKHKLGWEKLGSDSRKELYKIDGKPFFGTDGDVPRVSINSVSALAQGKLIQIPKAAYSDLYEPNFRNLQVYTSADHHRVYVTMMNSDGAGSYTVTWCIRNGKYIRRVVEYGW